MHKLKKEKIDISGEEIFLPTTPEEIEKEEQAEEEQAEEEFKALKLPTKPEELEEEE